MEFELEKEYRLEQDSELRFEADASSDLEIQVPSLSCILFIVTDKLSSGFWFGVPQGENSFRRVYLVTRELVFENCISLCHS